MMNCKDVEDNLPLYEDNLLSDAEKKVLEQHLKSCAKCAKALAQLQKTGRLVEGLEEVEPPPWFKQKIMFQVREEAEKKSLMQKWFYPLRIKIPVQIMATIVIAVLAVYIYRSGDEQMKVVLQPTAPTPVMEAKRDLISKQKEKPSEANETGVQKKVYVPEVTPNEKIVTQDAPAGSNVVKTPGLKKSMPPENERARTMDMAKTVEGGAAADRKDTYAARVPEKQTEQAKVAAPASVGLASKEEGHVLGDLMKQSGASAKQIITPKSVFSLHASDTNAAVAEVEKILQKYDAKKIVKQTPNGKVFLTAEIQAQKIKDFVAQLKTIGRVGGNDVPMDSVEGDIPVVIEILSK
jgi:glutaredoxin-related protein